MEHTYDIQKANQTMTSGKMINYKYLLFLFKKTFRKLQYLIIFSICFIFTMLIYKLYVTEITLENTITIGALISALGSCLASISSLQCEKSISHFNSNLTSMFENQKAFNAKWERKPYEKRIIRHKYNKRQYEYTYFKNAIIKFKINDWETNVDIPSSDEDFYEIPILKNYIKLKTRRNTYRKNLCFFNDSGITADIFVWDNLLDIYKNIIEYKLFYIISSFGWSIVINSLVFSFFYHYVSSILNF